MIILRKTISTTILFLLSSMVIASTQEASLQLKDTQLIEKPLVEPLTHLADPFQSLLSTQQKATYPEPSSNTVWGKIQNNLTLHFDPDHPRVIKERKRYTHNPRYVTKVTKRAQPYLYHIVSALHKADLPLELAALPIVESAYISTARSRHAAVGLWQFIRPTAKQFGLKKNAWYDGRRDTIASTQAAIDYLSYLSKRYDGDWLLALAAYNAGETNVNRAIERNIKKNKPTDYWSLRLPPETMLYVPRFLAAVSIIQAPEVYQIKLEPVPYQPYFQKVSVPGKTSLLKLSRQLKADSDTILALNAGLKFGVTPANQKTDILLPKANASKFYALHNTFKDKIIVASVHHRVERGETLSQISQRYGVPIKEIKVSNQLSNSRIRAGQTLRIPES